MGLKELKEAIDKVEGFLPESSLARLQNALGDETVNFCILSANRSELTPEENQQKTMELKGMLQRFAGSKILKQGFIELEGGFVETGIDSEQIPVKEDSFLVYNMPKDDGILLGKQFNQESILVKEGTSLNEYACATGEAIGSFLLQTFNMDKVNGENPDAETVNAYNNQTNMTRPDTRDLKGGHYYTSLKKGAHAGNKRTFHYNSPPENGVGNRALQRAQAYRNRNTGGNV